MEITRGKQGGAIKCVLYGVEGIGKSTFASQWPNPVYIDTEGSTTHMDVARLPKPETWGDLIHEVQWCVDNSSQLQTLVIDTADWADAMAQHHIAIESGKNSIEQIGFGKGYKMVAEVFQKQLLKNLDELVRKDVNVLLIAHAAIRKAELPDELGSYDHYELKLSKQTAPLVKEWADMVLFVNYETDVVKTSDGKTKARGGKKRTMYANHDAVYDAKNRFGLPDQMPFEFDAIKHLTIPEKPLIVGIKIEDEEHPVPPIEGITEPKKQRTKVKKTESILDDRDDDMKSDDAEKDKLLKILDERMVEKKISKASLIAVIAEHNFYSASVKPNEYDTEFIQKMLIDSWEQVLPMLQTKENELPF